MKLYQVTTKTMVAFVIARSMTDAAKKFADHQRLAYPDQTLQDAKSITMVGEGPIVPLADLRAAVGLADKAEED